MSKQGRNRRERRIRVRGVRRSAPDVQKLGQAVLELAMAQAEADAMVEAEQRKAAERRAAKKAKLKQQDRKSA